MTDRPSEVLHDFSDAAEWLARIAPSVEFCSLRLIEERRDSLSVRRGVPQPAGLFHGRGAMVTVIDQGGLGYAATSDLSFSSLYQAARSAQEWAERTRAHSVTDFSTIERVRARGTYRSHVEIPWSAWGFADKLDRLAAVDRVLADDPKVVDRRIRLEGRVTESAFVTTDGTDLEQVRTRLVPEMVVIASHEGETQQRSFGGRGSCRQGGLEMLDALGFFEAPETLREEAVMLLSAPICPTDTMDLLLGPAQMILQIHESIGHPLELDRILGDERNYAGTSFVSPSDFGTLRYGSELLNVSFDPTLSEEFASYAFDDEGTSAEKVMLIEEGILRRGLGGTTSAARLSAGEGEIAPTEIEAVACARSCHWNRPPIDRMANLNLEPGNDSFGELLRKTRRGVYMDVNSSWSIDDSRRNFQFGCEVGRLVEDGNLTSWVRNPGYRGRSSDFWRSLAAVGDASTFEVLGTPNCGKGEPNQMVEVGHATPTCLFRGVDVFGTGR